MPDRFNWLLFAAALVAGLLIGFAASTAAFRYHLLHVPYEGVLVRMTRELKLTPVQRDQIAQVMENTRDRISDLRRQFRRDRREALTQAYGQIRALLSPEQQKKFDHLFIPPAERRRWHRRH